MPDTIEGEGETNVVEFHVERDGQFDTCWCQSRGLRPAGMASAVISPGAIVRATRPISPWCYRSGGGPFLEHRHAEDHFPD
jgi:hypothetical protein